VVHGATASAARPTGATYVEWIGSVTPTNMATNDTFINTSANGNQTDMFPAGMVVSSASAKTAASSGWYFIEGQQILISGDTNLYNEITNNATVFPYGANTNGAGAAGSTHFRLPDARGRVIVHADGTTEFAAVGTVFGAKTHTLTSAQMPSHTHVQNAHSHGVSDPGHVHTTNVGWNEQWGNFNWTFGSGTSNRNVWLFANVDSDSRTTGISIQNATPTNQSTGGDGAHNNVQPSLTMRYMIKR